MTETPRQAIPSTFSFILRGEAWRVERDGPRWIASPMGPGNEVAELVELHSVPNESSDDLTARIADAASVQTLTVEANGLPWTFLWYPGGLTAAPFEARGPCWLLTGVDDLAVETDVSLDGPEAFVRHQLTAWARTWSSLRGWRRFRANGMTWEVRRQGGNARSVAADELIGPVVASGLSFRSDAGKRLLRGQFGVAEFFKLSKDELADLLWRAEPVR